MSAERYILASRRFRILSDRRIIGVSHGLGRAGDIRAVRLGRPTRGLAPSRLS